jgi:predicted Fe-Mo cluster-binding NifX family protein
MTIAISACGPTLGAAVDGQFGRCPWFVLVNPADMSCRGVANMNAALPSGSGVQTARLVAGLGVSVVLTGSCGPHARQALSAAGIDVVVGCEGGVGQVVDRFKNGELRPATPVHDREPAMRA